MEYNMKEPDNIIALIFTKSRITELHEILKEFLHTIPHIKTEIIFDNKQATPLPCYVIPSNDYVSKIKHKLLYCSIPYTPMPIVDNTYYYTWFEDNKYCFTKLKMRNTSSNTAYIAISKEDYENYLSYT